MDHRRAARPGLMLALALAGALVVLVAVAEALGIAPLADDGAGDAVVNVLETLVAAAAAASCAARSVSLHRTARSAPSPRRRRQDGDDAVLARSWALWALACGSWAAGQAWWTWLESVRGVDPFPSLADVGFLGFAVLAPAAAVVTSRVSAPLVSRVRTALDGVIVAGSLFVTSWLTALGAVVEEGGSGVEMWISAAYPIGDVVVVAMVVMLLTRSTRSPAVWLLGAGALTMAVADSVFVWTITTGSWDSGGWCDVAWTGAFVLIGLAARVARPATARRRARSSLVGLVLPYLPVGVMVAASATDMSSGSPDGYVGPVTGMVVILAVLLRQWLTMLDNHRLVRALEQRRDQLQRLAYTDHLTGAANRTSFTTRLERVGQSEPAVVAYLDVDAFKSVNDEHGHAVGDAVLVSVATRLAEVAGPGDVVARLGGDEFAVLVTGDGAAEPAAGERLRARLVDAVARPLPVPASAAGAAAAHELRRVLARVRVSVGVVCSADLPGPLTGESLLHAADERMYAAKRARAVAAAADAAPAAVHARP